MTRKKLVPCVLLLTELSLGQSTTSKARTEYLVREVEEAIAEQRYEDAAGVLETMLAMTPPESLAEANLRRYLGDVHQDLGRYFDAELDYRRSVSIARNAGPAGNRLLAAALNALATCYLETDKLSIARQTLQEALQTANEMTVPDDDLRLSVLTNLAAIAQKSSDFEQAAESYDQALAISKSTYGSMSIQTAEVLSNFATLRFHERRLDDAVSMLLEAVTILREVTAPESPNVARALINLAAFRTAQGRLDAAQTVAEEALEILSRTLPDNHPHIAVLLDNYAYILKRTGDRPKARELRKKARAIRAQNQEDNRTDHTIDVSAFTIKQ